MPFLNLIYIRVQIHGNWLHINRDRQTEGRCWGLLTLLCLGTITVQEKMDVWCVSGRRESIAWVSQSFGDSFSPADSQLNWSRERQTGVVLPHAVQHSDYVVCSSFETQFFKFAVYKAVLLHCFVYNEEDKITRHGFVLCIYNFIGQSGYWEWTIHTTAKFYLHF